MCKSPLYAYQYIPKCTCLDGEIIDDPFMVSDRRLHFIPNCDSDKFNILRSESTDPSLTYLQVKCGQCIECRLQKSREWATRITCEQLTSEFPSMFVTLTYDDEHLPLSSEFGIPTLNFDHSKKFIDDLRAYCQYHYDWSGLRHYTAGEYGSSSSRPHYHSCLFNLPPQLLAENKPYKVSFNGDIYYNNPIFEKIWKRGFVVLGDLTYQSAAYVARYVTKKMTGEFKQEALTLGLVPEKAHMSNRPGIGGRFYDLHKKDIYEYDALYLPGVAKAAPPGYFDRKFALDDPEVMMFLKSQRALSAERSLEYKLSHTDKDFEDYMKAEEDSLKSRIKKLVRPL